MVLEVVDKVTGTIREAILEGNNFRLHLNDGKDSDKYNGNGNRNTMEIVAVLCLVTQSCPTLCDPINCSLLGSSVHGISQTRILEWVAISLSRRSF